METKKIFVVIPAFNEERSIAKIIRKSGNLVGKVIVVDDGSEDKTFEILKRTCNDSCSVIG